MASHQNEVVYGADSRRDHYQVTDSAVAGLAEHSVVAIMQPESLNESNPSDIRPIGERFQDRWSLCEGEPFANQTCASYCSGTLISEDLVITAGHCIQPEHLRCETLRVVFNFRMTSASRLATITSDDVYRCTEVVSLQHSESPFRDHAILRLDRPVRAPHRPAPLSTSTTGPARGERLTMIGFGVGLPMKIDQGGAVTDASFGVNAGGFYGTVDAFGGNSGSGVFNTSGEFVGILSGGNQDFVDTGRGCYATNRVSETPADTWDTGTAELIAYPHHAITDACGGTARGADICPGTRPTPPASPNPDAGMAPGGWRCDPSRYANRDGCDCGCGVPDPDCATSTEVHGCGFNQICSPIGTCADPPCVDPNSTDCGSLPGRPGANGSPQSGLVGSCSVNGGQFTVPGRGTCALFAILFARLGRSARRRRATS